MGGRPGGGMGGRVGDYTITSYPNRSAEAEMVSWAQVWQQD